VSAGKKSKLRKDRYSALIMANMAARKIDRTPDAPDYSFYGGFATITDHKPTGEMFTGPSWFTDGMKDVY